LEAISDLKGDILMLQEKRKLEREENKKAKAEAKAKAKAERQKLKEARTKEQTTSSPEVTSSTVLAAKPDVGVGYSLSLASVGSVEVVYQQGLAGTGQPYVEYPQLDLNFYALFALGSPIGMFQTVR